MPGDSPAKKLRGIPTVLPPWWLERAVSCWKQLKEKGWSVQRLGDALSQKYGRMLNGKPHRWDRKTIERFLANESPTQELMEAFCLLFPDVLVAPTYVADSEAEAKALRAIVEGFRASSTPDKGTRRRELVDEREAIEQRVRDQIVKLQSPEDEATGGPVRGAGGRRAGSVE